MNIRPLAAGIIALGLLVPATAAYATTEPETTSSPDISTQPESPQRTTPPSQDGAEATPATPTSTTGTSGTPESPAAQSQPIEPTGTSSSVPEQEQTASSSDPSTTTQTSTSPAPTPEAATVFSPYSASVSWLIPTSWPYKTTPTYQPGIYDQTRLTGPAPCGTWQQNDVYLIEDAADEAIYLGLGDVLTMGEDSAIYKSHAYTKTAPCTATPVVVPDLAPTPPTCDLPGGLPFTSWPAAQNPNGYEGDGFRVYLDRPYTPGDVGVWTGTFQKVGPGFDPKYPLGTKVSGNLKQTFTVLPATGTQSTDPSAPCYVAPPVEPPVVVPPVVTPPTTPPVVDVPPVVAPPTVTPTPDLPPVTTQQRVATGELLASTGTTESDTLRNILAAVGAAALVVFGAALLTLRRITRPRYSRKA